LTFGIAGYALANGGKTSGTVSTITDLDGVSAGNGTTEYAQLSGSTATFVADDTNSYDADATIDATDIMIEYANGPLLVRVARETIDDKATKAGASGSDQVTDSIGVSYKMGDLTMVGYAFDVANGGGTSTNDVDGYFVGAKMAMGANTFGIGYSEEDDVSSTGTKETGTDKNWMLSVDHALSKRTSITAAFEANEDGSTGADNDKWAVGLKHVF
jgi:hypothetical protein